MRSLVAGGGLVLRLVRCSCPPGTEGTSSCNYGRACGELRSHGRDVAGHDRTLTGAFVRLRGDLMSSPRIVVLGRRRKNSSRGSVPGLARFPYP